MRQIVLASKVIQVLKNSDHQVFMTFHWNLDNLSPSLRFILDKAYQPQIFHGHAGKKGDENGISFASFVFTRGLVFMRVNL